MTADTKAAKVALKAAIAHLNDPMFRDAIGEIGGLTLLRGSMKHAAVTGWALPRGKRSGGALVCNNAKVRELIRRALGGNADADAVLRDIAADMIAGGVPLPKGLCKYTVGILRLGTAGRKRGPNPNALKVRNIFIAEAVERVEQLGFKTTRNRATDAQDSACSIVKRAIAKFNIHKTEDAVVKIVYDARQAQSQRRKN